MDTLQYHDAHGRRIAFRHLAGEGPTIVFLPGYKSDMAGSKATAVFEWARKSGRGCLLLDYSGCGLSDGDFAEGTLSRWRDEVLALVAGASITSGSGSALSFTSNLTQIWLAGTVWGATHGINGFAVTVCDPREEYRGSWNVPAATVVSDMPDDVVLAFKPDRRSCVVALTHDPKLDDLALLEALNTEAFYVGGIGSRRNNEARRARLLEFGVSEEQAATLRGPAGIYIGSRTPAEIAVSIAAELVAMKNGVAGDKVLNVAQAKAALEVAADTLSACSK